MGHPVYLERIAERIALACRPYPANIFVWQANRSSNKCVSALGLTSQSKSLQKYAEKLVETKCPGASLSYCNTLIVFLPTSLKVLQSIYRSVQLY